ncbi:single-domain globin Cgb [Campylobacter insulaenigrae]|uniref:Single domain globin n=2 Tax=Campylobacter insulaenigrae TaxID=260714 RepID=A0A0A8H2Q7_9BACT|nr:single-domain globin Cgb [Campylobacter insulaenigrae]AJC88408.1 single domain globin [Campylobacter insulaenigrae NCTC 12927]MCR6571130.1 single-domain globin Cgb [Campylobacter insulaenigrae]MCR6572835.1 single-domain globin Cgb [Campylobacter insulaenigrae]MCR6574143.1 single-domain globin Cgb [Campylobacter insulaenigrae]MCR6575734.1 single-domain globin Cgb [Campylobacter insulaenigrae]
MTKEEIQIIKDCVPILQQNGEVLTREFYKIMFEEYPQVKPMFNMDKQNSGEQPKALALAILTAAKNIENLENMRSFVDKVAITHTNLNVKEEHYPIVGACLLKAIKVILNADDTTLKAWEKAYGIIAKFYIDIEKEIYAKNQ